ncbi:MAG: PilZ domain-containing protein [Nitrospirae bacterium]|nr:PilZ domain-containing protein [Nitrospirota bacterium]
MSDRRRHKRVGLVRQVEIAPLQRKKNVNALVVNISRSGLEMYSNVSFPEGTGIIVRMVFMDEEGVDRPEVVSGKVRWNHPLRDQYAVGVEFQELNERDHFMLLAYISYAEGFECRVICE